MWIIYEVRQWEQVLNLFLSSAYDDIKKKLPNYLGYKAMALYSIQGHPRPYNGYKAME